MNELTPHLHVRVAQKDDLSSLAGLAKRSDPHAWSADSIAGSIAAHDAYVLLQIAQDICSVIGLAVFLRASDEAELLYIVVDINFQRQGLGTHFLKHLLEKLAARTTKSVTLEVRSGNTAAQKMYKALGFVKVGVRKSYYPSTATNAAEDALVLCANLSQSVGREVLI
jgi:[ribosomal protein S18]-alanine N-acetyltransferase